jgi:hypothetical protein
MFRPLAAALVLLTLAACSGGSPPPPVATASPTPPATGDDLRPLSSREAGAPPAGAASAPAGAAVDPVDPAEAGITELARLARYVFRTMRQHEQACPFDNPLQDRLHFALEVEVRAGRMTRVGVGHAGHGGDPQQSHEIPRESVPRALTAYVECLAPHLKSVVMAPAPADGVYEPVYTYPGNPMGQAAH